MNSVGRYRLLVMLGITMLLLSAALQAAELRGLWVDAFHPGFKTAEETSAMVAKAKECNFNALFIQVRKRGDVCYKSSIEPMVADVAPGYDPLADVVAKAHNAGMQVHAWVSVYEVYCDNKWTKSSASVHKAHPEWLMKDINGQTKFNGDRLYLDPGVPEVQKYLLSIVEEIAKKYEVDGIHLDLVRYPTSDSGYNDSSVALFNKAKNRVGKPKPEDSDWRDWRRSQITQFMGSAYKVAKKHKSGIQVSATVSSTRQSARDLDLQEWEGWLKSGILDFAVPLVFPYDSRVFQSASEDVLCARNGRVYIGQGGFKVGVAGTLKQIDIARKAGAPGLVVYSYSYCSAPRDGDSVSVMDALRSGPFSDPDSVPALQ